MAEKPEDLSLPASVVARIIKDALPDGVNVSKEARTAIGKAASVFVLYATACSNNFALKGKRKTLTAADVFSALEDMEFGQFIPELKECLEGYKQDQKEKKEAAADRKKKQQTSSANTTVPSSSDQQTPPLNVAASQESSSDSSDPQSRSVVLPPTVSPSTATGQQSHSEVTAMDTST